MFSLCLCGSLFILGLVNAQLDSLPGGYVGGRTPPLAHTGHRDVVIENDPMGSQPFSGGVGPIRDLLRQGLVAPDGMVIDLGTPNDPQFTNIVDEGRRIRLDGRHPPVGGLDYHDRGLNLRRAHASLGIGAGRQHGDIGLGILPGDTGVGHPRAGGHRHHRGRGAGRRFRLGSYSRDGLGGIGGQLVPEETWRDVTASPVGTDPGVPLAAGPGDHVGRSLGGP